MEVTIHVPDTLMQRLEGRRGEGLPRHVVESWVLEDYRAEVLTRGGAAVARVRDAV